MVEEDVGARRVGGRGTSVYDDGDDEDGGGLPGGDGEGASALDGARPLHWVLLMPMLAGRILAALYEAAAEDVAGRGPRAPAASALVASLSSALLLPAVEAALAMTADGGEGVGAGRAPAAAAPQQQPPLLSPAQEYRAAVLASLLRVPSLNPPALPLPVRALALTLAHAHVVADADTAVAADPSAMEEEGEEGGGGQSRRQSPAVVAAAAASSATTAIQPCACTADGSGPSRACPLLAHHAAVASRLAAGSCRVCEAVRPAHRRVLVTREEWGRVVAALAALLAYRAVRVSANAVRGAAAGGGAGGAGGSRPFAPPARPAPPPPIAAPSRDMEEDGEETGGGGERDAEGVQASAAAAAAAASTRSAWAAALEARDEAAGAAAEEAAARAREPDWQAFYVELA
jgi:hypothetical protein